MKRVIMMVVFFTLTGLPSLLSAQDINEVDKVEKKDKNKDDKKETQEIIIRNKAGKDMDLKIDIKGDQITVNGKPLSEFKDESITINKRKMITRKGDMVFDFGDDAMSFNMDKEFMREWKGKEVIKPFLGVTTEKIDEGAKVTEVVKASAAEKAGLKEDDIITKIGEKKITEEESLSELVSSRKPKEVVTVTYIRGGKVKTVKATLGERKVSGPMAYAYKSPKGQMRTFTIPKMAPAPSMEFYNEDGLAGIEHLAPDGGYNFGPHSYSRQKKLGLKIQDTDEGGNVKVIEVEEGSAAEKAGLKKDDIITEISGKKVMNTDEAREQLNPEEAKSTYSVKALRNGTPMTFDIKIPKKLKTADL